MARSLKPVTGAPIGLEAFLDEVRAGLNPADPDTALALAPAMAALVREPSFLSQALAAELRDWAGFQADNPYVFPCFVLARGPGWLVRANYWRPAAEVGRGDGNDRIDFYEICHNHTFSFLSAGLVGPGYRTALWQLDAAHSQRAAPGDLLPLGEAQELVLGPGELLWYERLTDVHLQFPPEEPSITLNLALFPPDGNTLEQLYLSSAGRVLQVRGAYTEGLAMVTELAGLLGGEPLVTLLEELAARSPSPRVRAAARRGILQATGDEDRARAGLENEPHPRVHRLPEDWS